MNSDEQYELREALQLMRQAIAKAEYAARHFELAIIDASSMPASDRFTVPLSNKVTELPLSSAVCWALDKVGVEYVWQLCSLSEYELKKIDGIGKVYYEQIENELRCVGLKVGCTSREVRSRLIYRFRITHSDPPIV